MSSPNTSRPKTSRVAKISVRPVWRRKIDSCQNSSDVVPNQPIPKPHTHTNDTSHKQSQTSKLASTKVSSHDEHAPSQNNNPNITTDSSQVAHSTKTPSTLETPFPSISCFHDYPSSNMSPPPRIPPPHPTTSHVTPMLHVQTFTQDNNNPTPPSSPSSNQSKFIDELREAHELNALLAMHLAQRNLPQSSSSPNLKHVETHVNNCICCMYLQQQTSSMCEHLTWIEYLLTKASLTPSPTQHSNSPSSSSTPNSPNPTPSPSNSPTSLLPQV